MNLLRVKVLLSSYNGADFLREQVDSVLRQQNVSVSIVIRDDGSNDRNTLEQLAVWQSRPDIDVHYGENIGVTRSFFRLLELADDAADYYAFCDQDDVWLAHKLERAADQLQTIKHDCALYCSRLAYVDQHLIETGCSRAPRAAISPANALVENYGAGCTMVFTPALRALAIAEKTPELIVMHDWWLYLIAAFLGQVVYDPTPTILYRQHDSNLVGGSSSIRGNLWRRFNWLLTASRSSPNWWSQAGEFYDRFYPMLSAKDRALLANIKAGRYGFSRRLKLIHGDNIPYRQALLDNLVFKSMLLCELF